MDCEGDVQRRVNKLLGWGRLRSGRLPLADRRHPDALLASQGCSRGPWRERAGGTPGADAGSGRMTHASAALGCGSAPYGGSLKN